ncbi:probable cytochrome P450 9f2 isoform X3 [Phlebotomus papatasi]|uniref:probable cytochrome P450 9f2 isoform X3 n=1 Tax=Phlebotomus papatasi TaxID=29031 RepID=UPI002484173B|nr:probable cytochrome P450 9f2 isoform X3 [Phlebotomus papatasi]
MIWLVLAIAIVALIVIMMMRKEEERRKYFESRGIKADKPRFFIVILYKFLTKQMGIVELLEGMYYEYPEENKVVGFWDGDTPIIMMKDPDVVKRFAVKEFEHFQDRRNFISEEMDPLFGNSLFLLKDQKWRDMRATLSPAFTGSKMRLMCDLIVEIGVQMVEFLQKEAKDKGPQTYEMKELFSRVSNDVIATCAFGINVDSLKHKSNDFYLTAKVLSDFNSVGKILRMTFSQYFPKISNAIGLKFNPDKDTNFFRSLVTDAMKYREQQNIVRPDMIHLLMEAKKGKLNHAKTEKDTAGFATVDESVQWKRSDRNWSEKEIVAQCFLFLLAGFETVSASLSFAAYEICANPEVQEKLYEEIKTVDEDLQGDRINYETLSKMKYLDMVISESLRKYPPATIAERQCNKDITLELFEGMPYDFKKKDGLWIPIYSLQRDPKYFPNPEKFDPERFSDENKSSINPNAYIPFGVGPRNCVGSRFALMELKTLVYYMVLNFSLEVTEQTQIPLQLGKTFGSLNSEKGIHIRLRPRN